jgi:hypothetical protein
MGWHMRVNNERAKHKEKKQKKQQLIREITTTTPPITRLLPSKVV